MNAHSVLRFTVANYTFVGNFEAAAIQSETSCSRDALSNRLLPRFTRPSVVERLQRELPEILVQSLGLCLDVLDNDTRQL
jgi:hypothetical protein